MTRILPLAAALALSAGLVTATAHASDSTSRAFGTMPPRAEWMKVSDLVRKFEAQGYTIHELDTDDGIYEIEMTDANGLRVEAYLHPVTGEPLQRQRDDD